MEPLEKDEYLGVIFFRDAYTIVTHRKLPYAVMLTGGDMNLWGNLFSMKLHRIGEKVQQDLGYLCSVGINDRQRDMRDRGLGVFTSL